MKKLEIITKDKILFCKECSNKVQAGTQWLLFCPQCKTVEEDGSELPDSIMSCCHCKQSVTVELTEDKRVVGRCYTENCGDCFSMQDLCLIKQPWAKTEQQKTTEYHQSLLDMMTLANVSEFADFVQRVFKANCYRFFQKKREDQVVLLAVIADRFLLQQCGSKKWVVIRILEDGTSKIHECEKLKEYQSSFLKTEKPVKSFKALSELMDFLTPFASVATFPPSAELKQIQPIDIEKCEKNLEDWYQLFMKLVPYGVVVEDNRNNTDINSLFQLTLPQTIVPKDIAVKNELNDDFHDSDYVFFYLHDKENMWIKNYKDTIEHLNKLYKIISLPL